MPNKMLIDATHPEETRVVVLRGNRVEEFDFESANRKQLRGNIYLAKVTRVEPSLQAAFVDYGGNRHGFLAFSEIHPDYYQIPVADRQALIDEEERAARAADAEADHRAGRRAQRESSRRRDEVRSEPVDTTDDASDAMVAVSEMMAPAAGEDHGGHDAPETEDATESAPDAPDDHADASGDGSRDPHPEHEQPPLELAQPEASIAPEQAPPGPNEAHADAPDGGDASVSEGAAAAGDNEQSNGNITEVNGNGAGDETVESVGGADAMEEVPERMYRPRRQYKIQEVIKRRQVMLVQVVKEERGTKGAALTTYLSLAGRYSVLMPNTARGGGISRKITSAEDRRKLKEIAQELEVPEGMGVILRTAGAARTKTEVKRDFEYLLRLWETVRDLTLKSTAPTLVYEEGSLVKRSIRDLYTKDIDEILVAGDDAYADAREFMRMLMPSHAKNVKAFRDTLPIFTRYGIESQLDAMFQPVVQLRSGGYIVLNQAEALVAIDVNSGRATREHHIEDTALKTNMEAAEEIARQLRLRDLAGLIVIDFIDMDEKRNNRTVERRLKESLKHDRARIQVGHISHFGLLEMSRQRIRSSVLESSTDKCPLCGGTGHVRSVSSVALQLLRSLEEMLLKGATHNVIVRTRTEIALYLLNHKRAHLRALEERFQIAIMVNADATIAGQLSYVIEKGEQVHTLEQAKAIAAQQPAPAAAPVEDEDDEEEDLVEEEAAVAEAAPEEEEDEPAETESRGEADGNGHKRRRRRRGRRGGRDVRDTREGEVAPEQSAAPVPADANEDDGEQGEEVQAGAEGDGPGADARAEGERRRRRRGRRGGRRNRRDRDGGDTLQPTADGTADGMADAEVQPAGEPQPFSRDEEPHVDERPRRHAREEAVERRPEHAAEAPDPEAPPPPAPAFELPEPEPPRRRSTVREPAPMIFGGEHAAPTSHQAPPQQPAEAPQPVVISPEASEEADRPRRSGWWSRKVLGKE
jgi:ribonuclease E